MLKLMYLTMRNLAFSIKEDDAVRVHPVICNYKKKAPYQVCRFLTKPYLEKIVVETNKTYATKEDAKKHRLDVIASIKRGIVRDD